MLGFLKNKKYSLPLDSRSAVAEDPLVDAIPTERRYYLQGFVCDTSPDSHCGPFQYAVDFIVPDGSGVFAARSGKVVEIVEEHDQYGLWPEYSPYLNYVTVDHGDGQYSQYAHLAQGSAEQMDINYVPVYVSLDGAWCVGQQLKERDFSESIYAKDLYHLHLLHHALEKHKQSQKRNHYFESDILGNVSGVKLGK